MSTPDSAPDTVAQPDPPEDDSRPRHDVGDVPWTVRDAMVVLLLWFLILTGLGLLLLSLLQRFLPEVEARAATLPVSALLFVAVTLLYVRRYAGATRKLFGPARPSKKAVVFGIGAGLVGLLLFAFGLGNLLQFIANAMRSELPEVQEGFREVAEQTSIAPLLVIYTVLIGPFAEELFYRGMLFAGLRRKLDLWPSIGISGFVFGLSHVQTTLEATLLVALIVIPFGMLLAWVYERTGTLAAPLAAHATFNLVQVIFLIQGAGAA